MILNEITVIGHQNDTYCEVNISCHQILDENTEYSKCLAFKITQKQKRIPIAYWIPEIQKNPTGARFIIASKYALQDKSLNLFSMSSMSYPPCTSFSTLYTKLAHDKLKSNFHPFLILLLKEGTKLFIRLSSGTAYWGKKTKGGLGFSKTSFKASLKTAINNLIKNCCYNIRNVTKKQAIGIPMGIDSVLFWTNLFLYFYEEESVSFPRHPGHFQDISTQQSTSLIIFAL